MEYTSTYSMDNIHPFPTRWCHGTNGGYEDVCFPINVCNQCNQMAISLPTVYMASLI